jgi:gluconolactonase
MRRILSLWFLLVVPVVLSAQEQNIPGLGKVGPAKVAATGFQFTEGPAVDAEGNVYFTDVPRNEIHKIDLEGKHTRFLEDTKGCNGMMFDTKGRLIACQGAEGRIVAIDPKTKAISPIAAEYEGKRFNRPNDLVVDRQGGVYFTDRLVRQGQSPQDKEGVYYATPDGKVTRLLEGHSPNGILLSPDEKTLYVLYSSAKTLHAYPVEQPGKVGPGKHFEAVTKPGDGLTVDTKGNLYVTQPRERFVMVMSPEGKELGQIRIPEGPSNVCFGGKEMRTLYITARTSVYTVELEVQGYCVARSGK